MQKLFISLSLIIFSLTPLLAEVIPNQPSEIEVLISEINQNKSEKF